MKEKYEPLFDYLLRDAELAPKLENAYRSLQIPTLQQKMALVLCIKHPAFGEDDYRVAQKYGFPVVVSVTSSGEISELIPDFAGKFFKDADPEIMDALKKKGLLYRKETIEHTYPFCWRCGTPLMYYARDSWYINCGF